MLRETGRCDGSRFARVGCFGGPAERVRTGSKLLPGGCPFGLDLGGVVRDVLPRRRLELLEAGVTTELLLLWSAVSATVGVLAILVAVRERRRGSKWWRLPAIFGVLLLVNSVLRLVWAA